MASMRGDLLFSFVLVVVSSFIIIHCAAYCDDHKCSFDAIYQFGDSISDTGNLVREPASQMVRYGRLPYGQNFPAGPTGRCSNGMLMVDYLAEAFSVPSPGPYLAKNGNFKGGVNFAVAGATALGTDVLAKMGISQLYTDSSLAVQLSWFETYLNANICSNKAECAEKLRNSLFIMGEIGGNDFNYATLAGLNPLELPKLTPLIVQAITAAVQKVIDYGAVRVMVPGNFPTGCFPCNLASLKSNISEAYDQFGCLKALNGFSTLNNVALLTALEALKLRNPGVVILYGDLYNSLLSVLRNSGKIGLDKKNLLNACCGLHGQDNNFDPIFFCGSDNTTVCSDPNEWVSWDGVHLTQKAYMHMSKWLVRDLVPKLKCN